MKLQSLRIITADIKRLVNFYEKATSINAKWFTEDFAEISAGICTLAIGSTKTLAFFGDAIAEPSVNKNVIIEFKVDNVDDVYIRIKNLTKDIVQEPVTMPWGNRSLLFRDPDGSLINFFTPVTPQAIEKFS
jgi:predicted enzyme related to lactoylglutathione lyase